MLVWTIRQLTLARKAYASTDSPRQLAMAVALGMLLGLIPKGNLIAAGLATILFALRINLPVAMLSALAFSALGHFLDPISHRIGLALLTLDSLQATWSRLYEFPVARWTAFYNSVVLGSLLTALALMMPTYWLSHLGFRRWRRASGRVVGETAQPAQEPAAQDPTRSRRRRRRDAEVSSLAISEASEAVEPVNRLAEPGVSTTGFGMLNDPPLPSLAATGHGDARPARAA